MDDKLIVAGLGKLDGEYPCDMFGMLYEETSPEFLTYGEARTIKQIANVRGGEILDAMQAGDFDVQLALAIVVLRRNLKNVDPDDFENTTVGSLRFVLAKVEADESLPPTTASGSPGSTTPPDANGGSSTSTTSEGSRETDLSPTGAPV